MPIIDLHTQPEATLKALTRVDTLEPDYFYQHHIKASQPIVATGLSKEWPALKTWSIPFFKQLSQHQTVRLEQGNIMQMQTRFSHSHLANYLNQLETNTIQTSHTPYLSLFNIFDAFPQLSQDVDFSLLKQHKTYSNCFAWLGPANTVTGYHKDASDNMLVQIQGKKRVKLISPSQTAYMYSSSKYDAGSTLSRVDDDNYCAKQYPLFAKTKAFYTVLTKGDALFIPKGWWHYVRALEVSISVNSFACTRLENGYNKTNGALKHYLHLLGLYGKECTCHRLVNGKRIKHHT